MGSGGKGYEEKPMLGVLGEKSTGWVFKGPKN